MEMSLGLCLLSFEHFRTYGQKIRAKYVRMKTQTVMWKWSILAKHPLPPLNKKALPFLILHIMGIENF